MGTGTQGSQGPWVPFGAYHQPLAHQLHIFTYWQAAGGVLAAAATAAVPTSLQPVKESAGRFLQKALT